MKRTSSAPLFAAALGILVLVMLVPVVAMLLSVPPATVATVFGRTEVRDALRVSLEASTLATLAATVIGVPGGYALARVRPAIRNAVMFALAVPLAFPPIASGVMLLHVIGTRTPLGAAMASHGIVFVDSLIGVALAEFFVSGSFVAITACAAFAAIPQRYLEAARTLGAPDTLIFREVALPLAAPGVIAGVLLAWLRAAGEYGATSVVAYHPSSLPVQLYVTLSADGVLPALAVAYGFVVLAVAIFGVQWALRRRVV
ncbi:MAG: ABC transporter permease subunit [Candidatus Eremiobacteraeota bacterium]|nr:ABC transporter permease subunit [Candidatus Eremiobacteraeota bacterium]